ncbi:hemagglutinin repeat-containing protein [Janthinobacterium sp.]|uniref:two-partner secretion domain-containing protein n=1 Tax=Janthinobacterium sp. TaxID=1871054 RepID=UPI00293D4A4D|nr:hemagglutinin repeat-containing protein [Janthinobacterium sp.]
MNIKHTQLPQALTLRPMALALLGASLFSLPTLTAAQVVANGANTTVYKAPNGVPVVDIATANGAGVSHNRYTQFNVDGKGLILNNGNSAQMARQSQLAGQLSANLNLLDPAKLIINEVNGANRSTLAGYIEVLGSRAEVVIANPYGITCSGCGFINTPRVTLSTGVPGIDPLTGNLSGFRVTQGDILINGAGLDGRSVAYLDLVARSVKVDGQVNAQDLSIAAGANNWDYASREASANAPAGAASAPGFDSTALGGMYANRIRILSTEQGVGVRMLGDAAAAAAELTITAAGAILVQSRLSAERGALNVSSNNASGIGAAALTVSGANAALSAGGDLTLLSSGAGNGITLSDASLNAGGALLLRSAGDLSDSAAVGTAKASRFAAGKLSIDVAGKAVVGNTSWGAGAALDATFGALQVAPAGASFYSGADGGAADKTLNMTTSEGDLNLAGASLRAPGAIKLSAGQASLQLGAGGKVESGDGIALDAGRRIDNAASVSAQNDLTLRSNNAKANLALLNSGVLQAGRTLSIAGFPAGGVAGQGLDLNNTAGAKLLAGATLDIQADTVANAGIVQAARDVNIAARGALSNAGAGLILNTAGGARLNLRAASLDNAGKLQSAGALSVSSDAGLNNSGSMLTQARAQGGGDGALTLQGDTISNSGVLDSAAGADLTAAKTLVNSGTVQSAGALTATLGTALSNAEGATWRSGGKVQIGSASAAFALDNQGRIEAGGDVVIGANGHVANLSNGAKAVLLGTTDTLTLGTLSNSGIVQAAQGVAITASGKVDNTASGVILTQGTPGAAIVIAAAGDLNNAGALQSSGALRAGSAANIVNSGSIVTRAPADGGNDGALVLQGATLSNAGLVAAGGDATLSADGALDNGGTLQGGRSLTASVGTALSNSARGKILSGGNVQIGGAGSVFAVNNAGRIQSGAALGVGGAGHRTQLLNASGAILLGDSVTLLAQNVDNSGLVQAREGLMLDASGGAVRNRLAGSMLTKGAAGKNVSITGGSVVNEGRLQSTGQLSLSSLSSLDNSGTLLTLASGADGGNDGALRVAAGLASYGALNNSGRALSNGAASFSGAAIDNSGTLQSVGALEVRTASTLSNSATGKISADGAVSIDSDHAFTLQNAGLLQSGAALGIGDAAHRVTITNTGTLIGASVSLVGVTLNNSGQDARILSVAGAGGDVALAFSGQVSNDGAIHADRALNIDAAAIANSATGGLSATGDLTLSANSQDIVNSGWIFSQRNMALRTFGHEIRNTATGSIEAATAPYGAISFDTGGGSFYNGNYIKSAGAMTINTGRFLNQAGDRLPDILEGALKSVGDTQVGDSGDFHCNVFGHDCAHSRLYRTDYTSDQYLSFAPTNNSPAQLLSTGDIRITYSGTAANVISLISGANVTITGLPGASFFENKDLSLLRKNYSRLVWERTDHNEVRYPGSEAAYDSVQGHENDNEAPGSWASANSNPDYGIPYARANGYAKLTDMKALPGAVGYNAGIYASGVFKYVGGSGVKQSASPFAASRPNGGAAPTGALDGHDVAQASAGDSAAALAAAAGAAGSGRTGPSTFVGSAGVVFVGPDLRLPSNPNGLFILAKNPNAGYLIETNPLFGADGAGVGSNYLAQRLGFDPVTVERRLGDANYETKLVRDQLIAQTNNFILKGYANEAEQMKGLMDSASSQYQELGLVFGTPLTAQQAGKLSQDLVWMVEQTVKGQKVLVPVVYLAAATRASVLNGAVIAANDVSIGGKTLQNDGGTIKAANKLTIATSGDINNISGNISGDSVALSSTGGSIVNRTSAEFLGTDTYGRTAIGATATISAGKDLSLSAAKDVSVIGAAIKSGGATSIDAGRDVLFDTIQNKSADSSAGSSSGAFSSSSWSRNEIDTRQIGASADSGGKLSIKSGQDVTVAGSKIKAGGNVAVDAGANLNLLDRQDVRQVTEISRSSGVSVSASGGKVGVNNVTNEETKATRTGTSVAASITSGGDTSLSAAQTLTVRGSDVDAGGELNLSGKNVQVLAGQNTFEQTIDTKKTTVGLSVGVDISAVTNVIDLAKGNKGSAAEVATMAAQAYANQGVSVGVNMSTTTTHSEQSDSTARVSTLKSGASTRVNAQQTATFEGSKVDAGDKIEVKAADINMVAARNTSSYTSQSNTTGLDIAMPVDASALVRKAAADNVRSGGGGGVTLATVSNTQRDTSANADKGTVSTFNAGGSVSRVASGTITDQGTQIVAGGNFVQKATSINMLASTDTTSSTSREVSNTGTVGVSMDFEPVKAFNDLKSGKIATLKDQLGGPTMGVDAKYVRADTGQSAASSTAVVGNVVAGGEISSTSTGATRLQGTNLASGGNTTLTAGSLTADAAHNTQSTDNQGNTVTVTGRAEVGASGKPSGSLSVDVGTSKDKSSDSQAQTGAILAGGNLTIKTTGDARFEGTTIDAKDNATLRIGGNLDMRAAKDSREASASSLDLTAGVSGSKASKGVSAGVAVAESSSKSSDAVTGSISAGNKLDISSGKAITFEGTSIAAGNNASIAALGDVKMLVATSGSSSNSLDVAVGVGASRSKTTQGASGKVKVGLSKADSMAETGSTIAVGGDLKISSGGVVTMQGTQADVGGAASVAAAGGVVQRAAVSDSSSSSTNVSVSGQVAGKRGGDKAADAPAASGADTAEGGGRPRSDAVTEAPAPAAKPGIMDRIKTGAINAKNKIVALKDRAKEKKNSTTYVIPTEVDPRKIHSSDSSHSETAVEIRQGASANVFKLPVVANVLALPAVAAASQLNAGLSGPLKQYGTQAAIPDSVKRALLTRAGVAIPAGADLAALLKQTQDAGKAAASAGLAGANISAAQQNTVLQSMGMSN